jgi:heptosyltransferase-2
MKKILVIKLGYSETLDKERSKIVSLGDVIRATVILKPLREKHPNCNITWLVSHEAFALVQGNEYIDRILIWDEFMPYVLMREKYDMVINLEKINGICALTDMIDAWEKIGFRFNSQDGDFDTYSKGEIAKMYIKEKESGARNIWQELIMGMLGLEWKKDTYSLGYKPKSEVKFDVGFNYKVGSKWPTKAMSEHKWVELESHLSKLGISYDYQKGENNLEEYMEWINSCRVIVSNDSLGLHLAFALGKKAIGLFGATDEKEIYFYNDSIALKPKCDYECMPCYKPECHKDTHCMEFIDIDEIVFHIRRFLSNP